MSTLHEDLAKYILTLEDDAQKYPLMQLVANHLRNMLERHAGPSDPSLVDVIGADALEEFADEIRDRFGDITAQWIAGMAQERAEQLRRITHE